MTTWECSPSPKPSLNGRGALGSPLITWIDSNHKRMYA